jgi:prepilin-type processing-associated H-X9-DG protein
VLDYVVNGIDFERFEYDPGRRDQRYTSGAASRVADVPGAASMVAYIVEANVEKLSARNYKYHDVLGPGHMPFEGWVPNNGRMIRHDDMRHYGKTTIVFFDGHAEPKELAPKEIPVQMFNPEDLTNYFARGGGEN